MSITENLEIIRRNIEQACLKVNREPHEITIIGVTKYVTIERTEELIKAGIKNIGENRTDELTTKYNKINNNDVKWHFIGTLQSRTTKEIIDKVDSIHSLDRLSVARQINNRSAQLIDCFVQVNVSGEKSKHGLAPEDTIHFIEQLKEYEKVRVVGLMTMAPHIQSEGKLREVFKQLRLLRDTIKNKKLPHAPCKYLSMGMSNDYEIAIEEGATHIRIGSKLVGGNSDTK